MRTPKRRGASGPLALARVWALAAAVAASVLASPPAPARPSASSAPPRSADSEAARALREEQVRLRKLLEALGERSEAYRVTLLRFVCEETLIRSEFDTATGRRREEEVERYDYLLSRARSGEVVERRRPLGSRGAVSWASIALRQPEPYLWSLLFTPHSQKLFNYRVVGQEVVHFRLATLIEFDAILPFVDGSRISEWSGRAYVDAETLDLLRVEAEPSGQQIRLQAAAQVYRQAFRLAGIPLRRRPRAHAHEVDLTYEREGLRFPALAITRHYVSPQEDERALRSQVMQIFSDYQLFKVETDEQIRAIRRAESP